LLHTYLGYAAGPEPDIPVGGMSSACEITGAVIDQCADAAPAAHRSRRLLGCVRNCVELDRSVALDLRPDRPRARLRSRAWTVSPPDR
jgi:hypothetical protein